MSALATIWKDNNKNWEKTTTDALAQLSSGKLGKEVDKNIKAMAAKRAAKKAAKASA